LCIRRSLTGLFVIIRGSDEAFVLGLRLSHSAVQAVLRFVELFYSR